jgi:hypothetical protein
MSDLLTRVHIHRVLIQVHPDRTIAKDLESWFKIALLPLYKRLVVVARVSNFGLSATEFSKVVFNAIRMVMPHELSQNASSEATRVLTHFLHSGKPLLRVRYTSEHSTHPADDILMQRQVQVDAIIEFLITEILELAGNVAMTHKKTNVDFRHVNMAVYHDSGLAFLLKDAVPSGMFAFFEPQSTGSLSSVCINRLKSRGAVMSMQKIQTRFRNEFPDHRFYDLWSKDVQNVLAHIAHIMTASTDVQFTAVLSKLNRTFQGEGGNLQEKLDVTIVDLILEYISANYPGVKTFAFQHLVAAILTNREASIVQKMLLSYGKRPVHCEAHDGNYNAN